MDSHQNNPNRRPTSSFEEEAGKTTGSFATERTPEQERRKAGHPEVPFPPLTPEKHPEVSPVPSPEVEPRTGATEIEPHRESPEAFPAKSPNVQPDQIPPEKAA